MRGRGKQQHPPIKRTYYHLPADHPFIRGAGEENQYAPEREADGLVPLGGDGDDHEYGGGENEPLARVHQVRVGQAVPRRVLGKKGPHHATNRRETFQYSRGRHR